MDSNYFDKLPNELIFIIFHKLNVSDLRNLRVVNKRFKEISCESVNDLIVYDDFELLDNYWYLSKDRKSSAKDDLIFNRSFSAFRRIFKLENSLRRLYLDYDYFDLSDLNNFKLLEHLEILGYTLKSDLLLDLPNLRSINFGSSNNERILNKLTLSSKKLEVICFNEDNLFNIYVAHPEQVKRLEISPINYNIEQFKNLEHLGLFGYRNLDKDVLSKLKKLKVLEFFKGKDDSEGVDVIAEFKSKLNYILQQRLVLGRNDLVIFLQGVEVDDQSIINNYYDCERFLFQLHYYDQLTGYLFEDNYLDEDDYVQLLVKFNNRIRSSFFEKFFNLHSVRLCNLEAAKQDQCSWFLDNLHDLKFLELTNCLFSQSFYDKLVNYPHLDELQIMIRDNDDLFDDYKLLNNHFINGTSPVLPDQIDSFIPGIKIDCVDFVSKLKFLRILNVPIKFEYSPFEIAKQLFEQSRYLETFMFGYKDVYYIIKKESNNRYNLKASRSRMDKFGAIDEIDSNDGNESDDKNIKRDVFLAFDLNLEELIVFSKLKLPFLPFKPKLITLNDSWS